MYVILDFLRHVIFMRFYAWMGLALIVWGSSLSHATSLIDVVEAYYGLNRQALTCVMRASGLLKEQETLDERFPVKIPEDLIRHLLSFVQLTQAEWVKRQPSQSGQPMKERWEVAPSDWTEGAEHDDNVRQALEDLGMTCSINSSFSQEGNALCILGATMPAMKKRLHYVDTLVKGEKKHVTLILLGGERYASKPDGSEEERLTIAQEQGIDPEKLTEMHLLRAAYRQTSLSKNKRIILHEVDVPKLNLPRPTTETTVATLIQWLKAHKNIKSITFVSNQPFVQYQKAVIAQTLAAQGVELKFEVIGPGYTQEKEVQEIKSISTGMLNVASQINALGSFVWARTPMVLHELNIPIGKKERLELQNLYQGSPSAFKILELLLESQ